MAVISLVAVIFLKLISCKEVQSLINMTMKGIMISTVGSGTWVWFNMFRCLLCGMNETTKVIVLDLGNKSGLNIVVVRRSLV